MNHHLFTGLFLLCNTATHLTHTEKFSCTPQDLASARRLDTIFNDLLALQKESHGKFVYLDRVLQDIDITLAWNNGCAYYISLATIQTIEKEAPVFTGEAASWKLRIKPVNVLNISDINCSWKRLDCQGKNTAFKALVVEDQFNDLLFDNPKIESTRKNILKQIIAKVQPLIKKHHPDAIFLDIKDTQGYPAIIELL